MRGLGVTKGFDSARENGWYIRVRQADGSRPKTYFSSEKERDKEFRAKVGDVRTLGVTALATFNSDDRAAIAEMKQLAGPTGLTPLQIFHRGLAQVGAGVSINRLSIAEANAGFLPEQKLRLEEKKISAARYSELNSVMTRFVAAKGGALLTNPGLRTLVKTYLVSLKVGAQTRVNHARILSFFFNWCIAEGMLFMNPVPEQEGVDRIPVVFSNEEAWRLFDCAREHAPALLPMLALEWYAGIRPGAAQNIYWEHIDFERRRILVHPHLNKLRQPDIVEDLPLTVFAFLAPLRQSAGRIAPAGHVKQTRLVHHLLGFKGKGDERWPEDVARHTFASNLLPLYDLDRKRVQDVLLHKTSAMLLKHYLLKNIPLAKAQAFFGSHLPSA